MSLVRVVGRHRALLVIVLGLVAAVAVVLVTGQQRVPHDEPFDPANPGPDGAQAVARVLSAQGVSVDVVRSADAIDDVLDGALDGDLGGATVVVTEAGALGGSTIDRLVAGAARSRVGRVVVVDPPLAVLRELGLGDPPSAPAGDLAAGSAVSAGCADPLVAGLSITVDDAQRLPAGGGVSCFGGAVTLGAAGPDGVAVDLIGAPQVLSNDQVLRGDNAAVALRLLGREGRLVWYVADAADLSAGDGVGLASLLPDAVLPGLAVLGLAVLALILWRARRLGPLVVEPLPVVVKAVETTLSRGRLYRRSGDRGHAAAVLRSAARRRARTRLRLDGDSGEAGEAADAALVRAVAERTGRSEPEVNRLLGVHAAPPTSDRDLVGLATDLTRLDDEVRAP